MKIFFYSPVAFEKWDFRTPNTTGIGGSETSHIEMAWRLARRGHEVVSYSPLPKDCPGEDRGVKYLDLKDADFTQPGVWVLYRCPEVMDKFSETDPNQVRWLVCQDTHYPTFSEARIKKLDKVLPISPSHADYLMQVFPYMTQKLWITSNGIRCDLIRELEKEGVPERNPHRLLYASSPDRGLVPLLQIFKRAREFVPDLELRIAYGFNNIDKWGAKKHSHLAKLKAEVLKLAKQPGVTLLGRINQRQLYREWMQAGLWVHPTDFTETGCITSMEAMALGAVPITRPLWAIKDNCGFGIMIEGSPAHDPIVRARYLGNIIYACQPTQEGRPDAPKETLQDRMRPMMMRWARERFNWERRVDQWEMTLLTNNYLMAPPSGQFCFQHKHARGRILNVGCDADVTGFLHRGAVNMDVLLESPITKAKNPAHVIHDARLPFPECIGQFDTVILGDIMEHLTHEDGIKALINARQVLAPKGRVIITVPDDGNRTALEQHLCAHGEMEYAPGVRAFHHRDITRENVVEQIELAGLKAVDYQPLDYTFASGHAFVAQLPREVSA